MRSQTETIVAIYRLNSRFRAHLQDLYCYASGRGGHAPPKSPTAHRNVSGSNPYWIITMNPVNTIVGTIGFDDTGNPLSLWLRRSFFAVFYNTTFIANALFAAGSSTPYLVHAGFAGSLTLALVGIVVAAVLLSTYSYSLIYIVNDFIDRSKDERLEIPKQTARHVLGDRYLWWMGFGYVLVLAAVFTVWRQLAVALAAYAASLMVLSVAHSKARQLKLFTIFIERWAKFCSPLILLCAAGSGHGVGAMLAGAVIAYPFGFMSDYALSGYLQGRLKLPIAWRWVLYSAYWPLAAVALVGLAGGWNAAAAALPNVGAYEIIYFSIVALTYGLAQAWHLGFLDRRYTPVVATEKRQLLIYGMIQVIIIGIGVIYAAVR